VVCFVFFFSLLRAVLSHRCGPSGKPQDVAMGLEEVKTPLKPVLLLRKGVSRCALKSYDVSEWE